MRPILPNKKEEPSHHSKGFSMRNIFRGKSNNLLPVPESKIIAEDLDLFDIAPHDEESCTKVLTGKDSILINALPGDYIRFMKNVGGGGGHRLIVNEFRALIQLFPN